MFKKVTRNIRRHRDSDEDGEAEDDTAVPSPASLSSSNTASAVQTSTISTLPAAASSAGSRVKLSFEDDEDGNAEFRIRKSAASRRLARLKNIAANNPENTFSTDRSDIQPKREPVATKSNGKTGRPKAATVSDSDSEGDAHSEERLEKLRREFTTLGGGKEESAGEPSEARTRTGAQKTGSADVDWLLRPGAIPDPALIHYARQRRLAARNLQESGELQVAAVSEDIDHAALGLAVAPESEGEPRSERPFENIVKSKKAGESRLVREDENDVSDEEEVLGGDIDAGAARIYTRSAIHKAHDERSRIRHDFLACEQGSEDEDEEEHSEKKGGADKKKAADGVTPRSAASESLREAAIVEDWESQQIRKGVSTVLVPQGTQSTAAVAQAASFVPENPYGYPMPAATAAAYYPYMNVAAAYSGLAPVSSFAPAASYGIGGGAVAGSGATTTISSLLKSVREYSARERAAAAERAKEREQMRDRVLECVNWVARFSAKAGELDRQYRSSQQQRRFVLDLIECFDEKMPAIENLEQRVLRLYEMRTERLRKRRQLDLQDLASDLMPLGKASSQPDESKMIRTTEREARRMRRRRGRETLASQGSRSQSLLELYREGVSSDDEQTGSETALFNTELDKIRTETRELFADVVEQYASPSAILETLAEWHEQSPRLYRDAYVSEYVRELLAPLIRLALLEWNPLFSSQSQSQSTSSPSLFLRECSPTEILSNRVPERDSSLALGAETLFGDTVPSWFVALFHFSRQIIDRERGNSSPSEGPAAGADNAAANELEGQQQKQQIQKAADSKPTQLPSRLPEETLVADIVERIVLPKIQALVSASWDPLSRSETARLARLLAALRAEFPTLVALSASSVAGAPPAKLPAQWRDLLLALLRRIRYSLEHDLFVPLYPKAVNENKSSPAFQFLQRQYWSSLKLMSNVLRLNAELSDQALRAIAIDGILNRYVLLALQLVDLNPPAETLLRVQTITSALPERWQSPDAVLPKEVSESMQPFFKFLAAAIETFANSASSSDAGSHAFRESCAVASQQLFSLLEKLTALGSGEQLAALGTKSLPAFVRRSTSTAPLPSAHAAISFALVAAANAAKTKVTAASSAHS